MYCTSNKKLFFFSEFILIVCVSTAYVSMRVNSAQLRLIVDESVQCGLFQTTLNM